MNDSTELRVAHAADNAFARWFTAYGLPVMLLILTTLVGVVWNDLKAGQESAARAQLENAKATMENAMEIQRTRTDVTLLRAEVTSGIMWRLQKLEEKQDAFSRAVKTP